MVSALLLAVLLIAVAAHPTVYPHVAYQRLKHNHHHIPNPPPGIISYHVHITYTLFNPDIVQRAIELRNRTKEEFSPFLGPDCPGRYDYGYLCMIADHDFANSTLIGGPFQSGEWSIFIPVGYHSLVVPWLLQNKGNFSMVVHPNTGYEYEDHSIWASWSGEKWPLDMTIFEKDTQTNEFGHYPNDPDNPICLGKGAVCGDDQFLGPPTLCCFGLSCSTPDVIPNGGSNFTIYRCG